MASPLHAVVGLTILISTATAFTTPSSIWTNRAVVRAHALPTNVPDFGRDTSKPPPKDESWKDLKRDAQGFIIKEDLAFDTTGTDVSSDLGSSAGYVELPESVQSFLDKVKSSPKEVKFADTMAIIEENCEYLPNAFSVGALSSKAGENEGSNKIFSFARLVGLAGEPIEETLAMFGEYYFKDVLGSPDGSDHGNIRGAMKAGWSGVRFPNGISLSLAGRTFGTEATVGELLEQAEVIEGGDTWDPMSDCWIP